MGQTIGMPGWPAVQADRVQDLDPAVGGEETRPAAAQPTRARPSGFFGLRTPLLAFDEWASWGGGLEARGANGHASYEDEAVVRSRLRTIMGRPEVREAILVASPDLEDAISGWEQDPNGGRGPGVERALVRYFTRMTTRATPFGLFAGHSVGVVGDRTRLMLAGRNEYRRHSGLDFSHLAAVAEVVSASPGVRDALVHRTNQTLYRAAGTLRYTTVRQQSGERRHSLVSVPESPPLLTVVSRTGSEAGASPRDLAKELNEAGFCDKDARHYVDQLIEHQILVPEVGPVVTGPEPLRHFASQVRPLAGMVPMVVRLDEAAAQLAALDRSGFGNPAPRYRQIEPRFESRSVDASVAHAVVVDLIKPAPTATLGRGVVAEIQRAADVLRLVAPATPNSELDEFCTAFENRYGTREVPLMEALDPELGIGFGSTQAGHPILDGVALSGRDNLAPPWSCRDDVLVGKVVQAAAAGVDEIQLTTDDVAAMTAAEPLPLPRAFAVRATVAARSDHAVDHGDFRVAVHAVSGPSGGLLFGRFCESDPQLYRLVQAHLAAEEAQDPEAIFAEVVFDPGGGDGNLARRPLLRAHEIPVWGRSGADRKRQIPVSDLLVSAAGGRVALRSQQLGQRVVPRLTSAHNYRSRSHPAYRFLGQVQSHRTAGAGRLTWDWGHLAKLPFLPRVMYRRALLSPTRWSIDGTSLRFAESGAARLAAVGRWRAQMAVPTLGVVVDGDNRLAIDFGNPLSVDAFAHLVRGRREVVLEEFFPRPEELRAVGPEGRFVHEVVVPFLVPDDKAHPRSHAGRAKAGKRPETPENFHRRFPPGSEWLYAKLYAAPSIGDRLLTQVLGTLCARALDSGAADSWFFVRYADPDWHLRVRVHGAAARLGSEVRPAFEEAIGALVDDGRVWRLEFGTYEREVERYGGTEGIVLAERIFHIDTELVLDVLRLLVTGEEGSAERWRVVLVGIDRLLNDFRLDAAAKHGLMKAMWARVAAEHGVGAGLESQLGRKFRAERPELEALTDPSRWTSQVSSFAPALERRSIRLAPLVAELHDLDAGGALSRPLPDIVAVHAHMFANRLLRSEPRAQELVLYSYLLRLYSSTRARL